jgi:pimeloyl-ACP methyl ester carboxylesterase
MDKISRRTLAGLGLAAPLWLGAPLAARARAVDGGDFVPIGGLDQWISIRGRNAAAPAILVLHGGPGEALSPFPELFEPWENLFTVAVWDQRGAGKTYGRTGASTPGMDPDQFVADTLGTAEYVRKSLGKRRIVLLGHSWGAALALRAGKRRPDLFDAVVVTGQPVSNRLTVLSNERFARGVLEAKGDSAGLQALDAASKLPFTDLKRRFATRSIAMGPEDNSFLDRERKFMGPRPYPTTGPTADWFAGFSFTSEVLVPKILGQDLVDQVGMDLPFPYVLIQGRDDHICPTDVAKDYFDKARAPAKAYAEIRGGHFACFTNPEGFTDALRTRVLPLCRS